MDARVHMSVRLLLLSPPVVSDVCTADVVRRVGVPLLFFCFQFAVSVRVRCVAFVFCNSVLVSSAQPCNPSTVPALFVVCLHVQLDCAIHCCSPYSRRDCCRSVTRKTAVWYVPPRYYVCARHYPLIYVMLL